MPAAAQLASIPGVPRSSTTAESPSRAVRRAMAHPRSRRPTIATSAVRPAPLLVVIPQHFTRTPWRQREEGAEEAGRLRALSVRRVRRVVLFRACSGPPRWPIRRVRGSDSAIGCDARVSAPSEPPGEPTGAAD
jgi:hypothetical protein